MDGSDGGTGTRAAERRPTLIFDGDCGFCTAAARFARRRLPADVHVVPWQMIDDPGSVALTAETIGDAAWWVDEGGAPHRGHRGLAKAAEAFGGGWSALASLIAIPAVDRLAASVYGAVARHRHRLPGATPACRPATGPGASTGRGG